MSRHNGYYNRSNDPWIVNRYMIRAARGQRGSYGGGPGCLVLLFGLLPLLWACCVLATVCGLAF